ncbi:MAG: hypothetical protein LBG60_09485 [Bifidobacteriaceae bacterium]|nr:hypothetical protein [Bifidobacteriaceae bacterium]
MSERRPPLEDSWNLEALADIERLDARDPDLADAAWAAVSDLLNRRKTGKALGARKVSGDLTGLFRIKFDLPGQDPERYRMVYERIGTNAVLIWGFGLRQAHAVYKGIDARRRSE